MKELWQDLRIYGAQYHRWRDGKYSGVATSTDNEIRGECFLTDVPDENEKAFEVFITDGWALINRKDA